MQKLGKLKKIGVALVAAAVLVAGCGSGATGGTSGDTGSNGTPAASESAGAGNGDAGNASKGTINIGYVTWAEDVALTNLWQIILENKGYDVTIQQAKAGPIFGGLAKGDVDFFMDYWLPVTHASYKKQYGDKLEDLGIWYDGAKIGLTVPQYMKIDSIADINSVADKIGGQIVGIGAGAGIMKTTKKAIPAYGLNVKLLDGSEAAMMAALDKAYQKQEPIVITGWSPHWMFAKYKLKYLKDPKGIYGASEKIHTAARLGFSKDFPKVAKALGNMKMNDQLLGELEAYHATDGMSSHDAAEKWLSKHQDVVDGWFGE